ncbi:restriction endonuclease subunit S [Erythrobacter oryzae]|uniref:restriction endonuclease subunit S n=1 Tax=Erythrobacter oryzae TaxID=3019556 RepID=UPI0025566876|nr:restriction endonuclease subunit S [Erythrobacter sp. COR-2]
MSSKATSAVAGGQDQMGGLMPKLRFPDFREAEGWNPVPLSQTCRPINEKVGGVNLTPVSITAGLGFVSQASKFGRDISGDQYKNYTYLRFGDFAYNKGNSKKYPQGYVCQLKEFEEAAASSAFICFRLNPEHEPAFFQAAFDQNLHGRQLSKYITSGARSDGLLNIRPDAFYSVNIPIPPTPGEQQKIADCLLSIDTLIAAEAEKLEALKDHKKGLMQQLFPAPGETTPRLRFPEFGGARDWDAKRLGSSAKKVGSGITPKGGNSAYSLSGRPFMRSQNVGWGELLLENVAFIAEELHATFPATEIHAGDVLLNITGASIGRSAIADGRISGGNVNQHVCIIRLKEHEMIPSYLNQFLLSPFGQSQIDSFQAGGNRQGLNFEQIRSFEVPCPPALREQERIADCLSSIDVLIAAKGSKIDALKAHKQGLIQQLFPVADQVQA